MHNLLSFILKRYYLFLFILLEVIAFFLFINDSYYQRSVFISATNQLTGNINQGVNEISDYFRLKKENEILSNENARFHNLAESAFQKTDQKVFIMDDTLYKQQYQYVAAKIISNSVNRRNNYLMLNKGARDDISKDMAVVSPLGIVGIVKDVSQNFCSVISILHKDAKVSAKIKKSGYVGTIVWNGEKYRYGNLKDIPYHVVLKKGDEVITSGYSLIFPEGLMIGTIEKFNLVEGDNFYDIRIRFSNDFNKIAYVYIVRNLMKEEQNQLLEKLKNE